MPRLFPNVVLAPLPRWPFCAYQLSPSETGSLSESSFDSCLPRSFFLQGFSNMHEQLISQVPPVAELLLLPLLPGGCAVVLGQPCSCSDTSRHVCQVCCLSSPSLPPVFLDSCMRSSFTDTTPLALLPAPNITVQTFSFFFLCGPSSCSLHRPLLAQFHPPAALSSVSVAVPKRGDVFPALLSCSLQACRCDENSSTTEP